MKSLHPLILALFLFLKESAVVSGFSSPVSPRHCAASRTRLSATADIRSDRHCQEEGPPSSSDERRGLSSSSSSLSRRRAFLFGLLAAASSPALFATPSLANAASSMPSVTSAEFDIILKDSPKSILTVELSGPKSETALIRLVDGTVFTISDLVESSTDPRSPLKLVARCRLFGIPVRNTGLASALSGEGSLVSDGGKKKKSYMNPRVQEAEKKNEAKRERMAEDERERLEELYRMEGNEKGFLSE